MAKETKKTYPSIPIKHWWALRDKSGRAFQPPSHQVILLPLLVCKKDQPEQMSLLIW
jgi:hypothetical protein